jgi:hypothetical protein
MWQSGWVGANLPDKHNAPNYITPVIDEWVMCWRSLSPIMHTYMEHSAAYKLPSQFTRNAPIQQQFVLLAFRRVVTKVNRPSEGNLRYTGRVSFGKNLKTVSSSFLDTRFGYRSTRRKIPIQRNGLI